MENYFHSHVHLKNVDQFLESFLENQFSFCSNYLLLFSVGISCPCWVINNLENNNAKAKTQKKIFTWQIVTERSETATGSVLKIHKKTLEAFTDFSQNSQENTNLCRGLIFNLKLQVFFDKVAKNWSELASCCISTWIQK